MIIIVRVIQTQAGQILVRRFARTGKWRCKNLNTIELSLNQARLKILGLPGESPQVPSEQVISLSVIFPTPSEIYTCIWQCCLGI
jgi:hypothetical protein